MTIILSGRRHVVFERAVCAIRRLSTGAHAVRARINAAMHQAKLEVKQQAEPWRGRANSRIISVDPTYLHTCRNQSEARAHTIEVGMVR